MSRQFLRFGYEKQVINPDQFYNLDRNGTTVGFNLDLRLNYYRGMSVSCIERLEVAVDGKTVPQDQMRLRLNDKCFRMTDLPLLFAEYWGIQTTGHLEIHNGGLEAGEHDVAVQFELRCPYLQTAPRAYKMIDSSYSLRMPLQAGPCQTPKKYPTPNLAAHKLKMQHMNGIDFAVSLYSFTERFIKDPSYGFEGMFQDLNRFGVKKFEIVGAQMFRNYPTPSDAEINEILHLVKKYDVTPFSYGAYIDHGRYSDHDMNDDEIYGEILLEVETAHRLGCQYARLLYIPARFWPKLEQLAKLYNMVFCYEIHSPNRPSDPHIQELARIFAGLDRKHVGFVPDFGCYIERPNPLAVARYIEMGAKQELLDFIVANRWNGYTYETMCSKLEKIGGGEAEKNAASDWFGHMTFAPADLAGFQSILPLAKYFHGKFYHIGEDCVETTIPCETLFRMIVESGFQGTIMTEYEGHLFDLNDAVEQIDRHLRMEQQILNNLLEG
jgi:hypothetical protein